MNVLISGASGLIGRALTQYLMRHGHKVYPLERRLQQGPHYWRPEEGHVHLDPNIHLDAVINLNGVNIGEKRWNNARKQAIWDSRVQSTRVLAQAICDLTHKPKVFISASAVGFYGDTADTIVNEDAAAGDNYLAQLAQAWEAEANVVRNKGVRTVNLRTSMVLSPSGGALQAMLLPFKLGLGGRIGNGEQLMSWITLEDECAAIEFILNNDHLSGPVNLCAPNAVSNREFTRALGQALKRPTLLPMPAFMVKTLFGEMGELLLLGSVGTHPHALLEAGFEFKHPALDEALQSMGLG